MSTLRLISIQTLLLCLFVSLCAATAWQVLRGNHKIRLVNDVQTLSPQSLHSISQQGSQLNTPIKTKLQLDSNRFFLIDNQIENQHRGHTLLAIHHESKTNMNYIIDLGWVANSENAKAIIHTHQEQSIEGVLYPPSGFIWVEHPKHINAWPVHLSYLDLKAIQEHLSHPIDQRVLLSQKARLYKNASTSTELTIRAWRHYTYAIQFAFFACLVVAYSVYIAKQKTAQ